MKAHQKIKTKRFIQPEATDSTGITSYYSLKCKDALQGFQCHIKAQVYLLLCTIGIHATISIVGISICLFTK